MHDFSHRKSISIIVSATKQNKKWNNIADLNHLWSDEFVGKICERILVDAMHGVVCDRTLMNDIQSLNVFSSEMEPLSNRCRFQYEFSPKHQWRWENVIHMWTSRVFANSYVCGRPPTPLRCSTHIWVVFSSIIGWNEGQRILSQLEINAEEVTIVSCLSKMKNKQTKW